MANKLVELSHEPCQSGCGKDAAYALEIDGMVKGFYCSEHAGIVQKNLPENTNAHQSQNRVVSTPQQKLKQRQDEDRKIVEAKTILPVSKPEGVKK
jgi:hypothetical protein